MDKSSLEKELTGAFVKDATRKAEDAMKKRAILTARSYDEFRHLVAAATQKPIDKQDITKKAEVSANKSYLGTTSTHLQRRNDAIGFGITLPSSTSSSSSSFSSSSTAPSSSRLTQLPSTVSTRSDIEKAWRRLPKTTIDRYKYLLSLGPSTLETVFKYEIDGTLLGDFLNILRYGTEEMKNSLSSMNESAKNMDASNTTDNVKDNRTDLSSTSSSSSPTTYYAYVALTITILLSFSRAGRFDLALALLSKDEVNCVRYITEECKAFSELDEQRQSIEQVYHL